MNKLTRFFLFFYRSFSGKWKQWFIPGFSVILALLIPGGCQYDFPETANQYQADNLDLSSFVGVGDDYLAGFMDGALYDEGQQHSITAIFAGQLEKIGLQTFHQAGIQSVNGYNEYASDSAHLYGRYIYVFKDNQSEAPVIVTTTGEKVKSFSGDKNSLNDFSIPFLRIFQIDDPGLKTNKYYKRMAAEPSISTLLSQVKNRKPTFFVLWIGMSDILGYATSGGAGDSLPAVPAQMSPPDLTPATLFESRLNILLSSLLSQPDSKGVILSLPDIDDLPFFYYYSYNFIKLRGSKWTLANAFYHDFNLAVTENNQNPANAKRFYISFNDNGATPYPQPVVVEDSSLSDAFYPDGKPLPKIRQLKEGEMVFMNMPGEMLQNGLGSLIPVPGKYYLTKAQIKTIKSRIRVFNNILIEKVKANPGRLAFIDVRETIHEIANTGRLNGWGRPASDAILNFNGVPLNGRLKLNSIYSLDGLHFNQRGNACLVNQIIQGINKTFQSKIPEVDVNAYKGNVPVY